MERPITDEDIVKFLHFNKAKYISQIDLMQAAVQLLWPLGPPIDAGQRIAKLVMQELNSYGVPAPQIGTGPLGTGPLGTGPLGTGPLGTGPLGTGPLPQISPLG